MASAPRLLLRLAAAEIRGSRAFSLSFVLSLAIGLVGFLAIDALRTSVSVNVDERSKVILAADLALTSQKAFTADDRRTALGSLPPRTAIREETSLYSMVASGTQSRLVELRAVDAQFPFYGTPRLRHGGDLAPGGAGALDRSRIAWVFPEVLAQLGVEVGAPLKIGATAFIIDDVVESDPSVGTVGLSLAPKVYIGGAFLADTGLVTYGSRVFHTLLFKLPASGDPVKDLGLLDARATALRRDLRKKEVHVKTHRNASEDSSRLLTYLNDYLGLVALVALFLAGVGAMYLFRSFIARRGKDIAILLSVGARPAFAVGVYVVQLTILGAAAASDALLATLALLPLLPMVLGALAPQGLVPALGWESVAVALGAGVLGSLLFCQPTLLRIPSIKPQALFQEGSAPEPGRARRQAIGWVTLALVAWGLAVREAHSFRIGSLFVALVFGASLVFLALGAAATTALGRARHLRSWRIRLAALNLARRPASTLASFLALSLGALLITVVPEIRAMLATEFDRPDADKPPSLFLFDIQPEQLAPLTALLLDKKAVLENSSPMIRARLTHLNGKELAPPGEDEAEAAESRRASTKTDRDDKEKEQLKARMYNLSYRAALAPSETLVAGRPFTPGEKVPEGAPAPVSLEAGFADRLGLKLGDTLRFDVQGMPVEGRVQNLRRVRWASFQPNFFVQFAPGVLDDAPQQFVGSIPNLTREERIAVQAAVVAAFPNVSLIDVEQAVTRILAIAGQIGQAIAFMALMALAAGIAVLYAIATHKAKELSRDVALLKALGAAFGDVRRVLLLEFALLGLGAAGAGALAGTVVSYVVAQQVFDRLWAFNLWIPLAGAGAVAGLCVVTGWLAVRRSLATPALVLLQGGTQG